MFQLVLSKFYSNISDYLAYRGIKNEFIHLGSLSELKNHEKSKNKLFFSVYSIIKENSIDDGYSYEQSGDIFLENKSPIFFDVNIVACSTFEDEDFLNGLQLFSEIAGFLQVTKKIILEDANLNFKSANIRILEKTEDDTIKMWQQFGLTPMPSIFFKISTIPILGESKKLEVQRVSKIDLALESL